MSIVNIEFKARVKSLEEAENKLLELHPRYIGEDNQTDTYFNTPNGRIKLREGNIENALIFYERKDTAGAKQSDIILYKHKPDSTLKDILIKTSGIKVIVQKKRRIYFIGNVKFHFDTIVGLGCFIEAEAIDDNGSIGIEKLKKQCDHYLNLFGIDKEDLVAVSYSDLLLELKQ